MKICKENYPETDFYDTAELMTELGIGECFFTTLNEKGIPTPLVHTCVRPPQSRMDILTDDEIDQIVEDSDLVGKYNREVDRESAYEFLNAKLEDAADERHRQQMEEQQEKARQSRGRREEKSTFEEVLSSPVTRQVSNTIARELMRGLLGVMGVKSTSRRSTRRSSWLWCSIASEIVTQKIACFRIKKTELSDTNPLVKKQMNLK